MILPLVKYKNTHIAYMADLIPSAGHLPIPYVMAYEVRPLLTLTEKQNVLNKAIENNWTLFFEHDPITECITLERTERGIVKKDMMKLEDI